MLTTFHRLSESWFFKGILLITALSFMTFFGVGGLDEATSKSKPVIAVGDVEVSVGEFYAAYNKALGKMERIYRSSGAEISDENVFKEQVLAYVLQDEQSKAVVKSAANNMDIAVYPEKLASVVRSIPDFQDIEGNFNRSLFATFLNITGQSEAEFMNDLADNIRQNELLSPVAALVHVPAVMAENAYAKKFESRDVLVYDIAYDKVKLTEKPTEEEIQSYYDSEKEDAYMNPEYRTLSVIYLPFEDIFSSIPVTDEEVAEAYELGKEAYVKPETRKIDQMRFTTEDEALKALEATKKKNFRTVAKEMLSQSEKDTYLGDLPKSDVLFEAAYDLFSAKVGEVVGPVHSEFGWHLFKVLSVTPEEVTPFEKVKPAIISDIQKQKATDVLYDKSSEIDDYLGSGETLENAKKQFNLRSFTITDVDVTGKDRKGKLVQLPFVADDFQQLAFSLSEGMESSVSEAEDAFYVVRADKITSPDVKPLAEVRDEVVALWKDDKVKEKATATADELLKNMKEGKTKGAKAYNKLVADGDSDLSEKVKTRIFAMPLDEPEIVTDEKGIKVVMVTNIKPAEVGEDENGVKVLQVQENIRISKDVTAALLGDFADNYKVKVNDALIKKMFGNNTENE